MRVVGLISGTSYDGIDVAAVDLDLVDDSLELRVLGHSLVPYDDALRLMISEMLPPQSTTVGKVAQLDTAIGQAFGDAAAGVIAEYCDGSADLVVSHGQTVFHWRENGRARASLQVGEAAWVAERCGVPVISGLRTRDIAAGGEGAPLVSTMDVLLLGQYARPAIALNLGGIANITAVRPGVDPVAYDTGPGNALIDAAVTLLSKGTLRFDAGGALAASGDIRPQLLQRLLEDEFLHQSPPKSTGKERYNLAYLKAALHGAGEVRPEDLVATVTEVTVRTVARACEAHSPAQVLVSGGGIYNDVLMEGLTNALQPVPLRPIDVLGIPPKAKEAIAFAVLGFLTAHGLPGSIPSCTGARAARLLGSITPGDAPLRLPATVSAMPRRLSVMVNPLP